MKKIKYNCPSSNKAFGLALQALTVLALNPARFPSGRMADHLCSEATLIRRIMARLAQENIIEVREGRDGGYLLKRSPDAITCADVYAALHMGESLCEGMLDSAGEHPLGLHLQETFFEMAEKIQQSTLQVLRQYTIADLAQQSLNTTD